MKPTWRYPLSISLYKLRENRWVTLPFPVRHIDIPGQTHRHSRWVTSAFPVRHIGILGETHRHSRWVTSAFPVSHIPFPGEAHRQSQWVTSPFPVKMFIPLWRILIWNVNSQQEWRLASPGNEHMAHRESKKSIKGKYLSSILDLFHVSLEWYNFQLWWARENQTENGQTQLIQVQLKNYRLKLNSVKRT